MSILIKGMDMPTSCFYCPFREKVNPDDYVCMALNKEFEETFSLIVGKRHKDCPLVPVPPHGRLIDESDAITALLCDNDYAATLTVRNLPTIIPAEEDTQKDVGQDAAPAGPYDLLYEEGGPDA